MDVVITQFGLVYVWLMFLHGIGGLMGFLCSEAVKIPWG